jgi:hypothetical protein
VDQKKLHKIKKAVHEYACYLLKLKESQKNTPRQVVNISRGDSWHGLADAMNSSLSSVIVHHKNVSQTQGDLITLFSAENRCSGTGRL